MPFREDYVEPLRSCLADADDWHEVESCFQKHVVDDDIEDARPVVYAFGYMLVEASREEVRDRSGVFAPRIEWGNGAAFPAPLAEIPDEMLPIWAEYAEATGDVPVAASRLHDLLWTRRFGDPPVDHARAAVDAYLELAESWEGMNLVECISRALEISREIKDRQRLGAAVKKAIAVIEAEIATEEWRPGIPLRILSQLVTLKPDDRPDRLAELLSAAGERYEADPFIAQSISELQAALLPAKSRNQLQRAQVERWRTEASNATGILRYSHLQHALELARTYGMSDVADAIFGEIQGISVEELDLKRIGSEVSVPREEVEAYVAAIADGTSSWQEAYKQFGGHGPPSGAAADNVTLVEELAEKHPFTRIVTEQVLGAHGSLVFEARNQDDHQRLDVSQHEALRIRFWAPLGADMIAVVESKFGAPDRVELTDFFTTQFIDAEVAARLADGVLRFLGGDDEGALHVVLPQIEAAIRGVAARVGIPVIKNPDGERPGGVRPLGAILAALGGRMDESWRRYLVNALTDPLGVNLRNQVSHGLHGPVARGDVAIAIHIACHLRLWIPIRDEGGTDDVPTE